MTFLDSGKVDVAVITNMVKTILKPSGLSSEVQKFTSLQIVKYFTSGNFNITL